MGGEGMGIWGLPERWETARIGDYVVDVTSGFACAKKHAVPDGLPHLRPFNVGTDGKLDLSEIIHIPEDFKSGVERYYLQVGDVLFNNTNSVELVGKSAIVHEPLRCAFSNHITKLRVDRAQLLPEWLVLSLRQLWADGFFAARCRKWIGQAGFNTGMLADVEIPLPPLDEQRRIVARIEELFARIEEARRLRAAADQDAERLMPAALDSAWREMSRVEGVTTPLGELISDTRNGLYKPKRFYGHGTLFIRMYNIEDRHLTFEDTARVEAGQTEIAKFRLSEGDILFNRVNSPELVGKSAVVSSLPETAVYEAMLIRVRVDKTKLNPEFAVAMLNAPACLGDLRSRAKKAIAQASLNQQDLRETALPVPPLSEQRCIIEYLDGVQAQMTELKRLQAESAAELERLSGAVLARAFRGEL